MNSRIDTLFKCSTLILVIFHIEQAVAKYELGNVTNITAHHLKLSYFLSVAEYAILDF